LNIARIIPEDSKSPFVRRELRGMINFSKIPLFPFFKGGFWVILY